MTNLRYATMIVIIGCTAALWSAANSDAQPPHRRTKDRQNTHASQTQLLPAQVQPVLESAGSGPTGLVLENAGDAGSNAMGLAVCRVHVQFADPADRLLSIGFSNVVTNDPQGFFHVAAPRGGDTAPQADDVTQDPAVGYDSFVTIGIDAVPNGVTDGSATDPDFDSATFSSSGQVAGGWYNAPPTNGQGQPDADLRVLAAQFTVRSGFNVSGDVTAFYNDGATPFAAFFDCSDVFGCAAIADCADLDGNGIRDDGCLWWACDAGTCVSTDIIYADFGGGSGACPPDGSADANDRFHALNCFSNQDTLGNALAYPCEANPPAAYNVDAAGLVSPCNPDGVCDGNDAFAAINAFTASTTCTCPSGPRPTPPIPHRLRP